MKLELTIGKYNSIDKNAKVSFEFDKSIIGICDKDTFDVSAKVLENLVLQIVSSLGANEAKIYLFENMVSHSFAQIKNLFAMTENSVGKLLPTASEMNKFLENESVELTRRYSLLASAGVRSIEEYNQKSKVKLSYRFYLISGLVSLAMQNTQMMFILRGLFQTGANAGMFLIINHDLTTTRKLDLSEQNMGKFYEFLTDIGKEMMGFNFLADVIPFNNHPSYQKFILEYGYKPVFDDSFPSSLTSTIMEQIQEVQAINPLQDFIKVKIGTAGAKEAYFAMGDATFTLHAMISGATRSGKTSFVQNILLHICEKYSPEDISVLILDFGSVTFHPYSDIAHIAYVFDEPTNNTKAVNVFEYIHYEINRRKELYTVAGKKHKETIESLAEYKHYEHKTLPRLLILIDEFGTLMANRDVSRVATPIINIIAREGAKYGMHLCLINQSFASIEMPVDVKVNTAMRIALRANTPRDSYATLDNSNEAAYHIQNFQAVLNNDAGRSHANLIVSLDDAKDTIKERRREIKERFPKETLSDVDHFLQNKANSVEKHSVPISSDTKSPDWMR
ncbi:MAG: FtsK/SpoIIIE domain-containing protein [Sulfuricurvum sp.]|nr:FtsK/SpoIIIE domain-containing protein [Sulfuricurvum sp.]